MQRADARCCFIRCLTRHLPFLALIFFPHTISPKPRRPPRKTCGASSRLPRPSSFRLAAHHNLQAALTACENLISSREASRGGGGRRDGCTEANCRGTDLNACVATECCRLVAVEGGLAVRAPPWPAARPALAEALWVCTCHRSG